jgi:hypothetical protein
VNVRGAARDAEEEDDAEESARVWAATCELGTAVSNRVAECVCGRCADGRVESALGLCVGRARASASLALVIRRAEVTGAVRSVSASGARTAVALALESVATVPDAVTRARRDRPNKSDAIGDHHSIGTAFASVSVHC